MAKPEMAKPGCFSGFVRVLLCTGNGTSPPVYPSDQVAGTKETEQVHPNKDAITMAHDDGGATPGVVARLMGLDSLPTTNWVSKGTTPDSVPRSRSVSFIDYLLNIDLSQANHRRVKTSASFREVPALVQRKNHEIHEPVMLYWDDASKDQEFSSGFRKSEMGLQDSKQRKKQGRTKEIIRERVTVKKERSQGKKNKKISKLKNEPRRVPSKHGRKVRNHGEARDLSSTSPHSSTDSNSPLSNKQKKVLVETKLTKNIRNQQPPKKKIESEYSSENPSPVSVLDINDYPFLYGTDYQDDTSPLVSKSKWKSSVPLSLGDAVEDRASNNKACEAYPDFNTDYYLDLMLKLRTLTDNDIRDLACKSKRMCENESIEEICLVFEHKIFDLLLHEVIDEVVEFSC